jgi:hypothetical protein
MPYIEIRDETEVECDETSCKSNKEGQCRGNFNENDLQPNNRHYCSEYDPEFVNGTVILFKNEKELLEFLEEHKEHAPSIEYDSSVLRIVYKEPPHEPHQDKRAAFIRITKESEDRVIFKPSIEGSILIIPKAQTDLFE